MMDSDSDGTVSMADLEKFLKQTLQINQQIDQTKMDRLYRMLDIQKTGFIELSDIR